jgi:hypothetical protein
LLQVVKLILSVMKRGMTELKPKVVVAVALAMILILAGSPAALAMTD